MELIEPLVTSSAALNSSRELSRLGSWLLDKRASRWLVSSFQSTFLKLRVGVLSTLVSGMSSVNRMGRRLVLGPRRPGLVSQRVNRSSV